MTTKRMLRHFKPRIKAGAMALLILPIAALAGTSLGTAGGLFGEGKLLAAAIAFGAGLTLAVLALLVGKELVNGYERWLVRQDSEDLRRCVIPTCDRPLVRPFASGSGGFVCMDCVRRIERAGEMPGRVREAGL